MKDATRENRRYWLDFLLGMRSKVSSNLLNLRELILGNFKGRSFAQKSRGEMSFKTNISGGQTNQAQTVNINHFYSKQHSGQF